MLPGLRSYELNAYAGWIEPWDQTWDYRMSSLFRIFRKTTDIPAKIPAGLIYTFMDVNPDSICWPYFGMHMDRDSFFNFPNASHNRGGVVAFADSHVEYHKWMDPRTSIRWAWTGTSTINPRRATWIISGCATEPRFITDVEREA